ncbi:MAG: hypothetical protein ACLFOY_12600 [Desulfatibacillaceae bacterium]
MSIVKYAGIALMLIALPIAVLAFEVMTDEDLEEVCGKISMDDTAQMVLSGQAASQSGWRGDMYAASGTPMCYENVDRRIDMRMTAGNPGEGGRTFEGFHNALGSADSGTGFTGDAAQAVGGQLMGTMMASTFGAVSEALGGVLPMDQVGDMGMSGLNMAVTRAGIGFNPGAMAGMGGIPGGMPGSGGDMLPGSVANFRFQASGTLSGFRIKSTMGDVTMGGVQAESMSASVKLRP